MGRSIAIIVPTCRPELYLQTFVPAWDELFKKHNVHLITVFDQKKTKDIYLKHEEGYTSTAYSIQEVMVDNVDLIYNRNAGIKNVGFAYVAKNLPEVEYLIALDDDVKPVGDPIRDHLDALNMRVPISWMSVGDVYTRGFPYCLREEAEVVLSHGVWDGCPDLDAPTQLIRGTSPMNFVKGVIPKGIYYPMCEMNIAFKRKMLPYMYLAPFIPEAGFGRNDDIFTGIESKREIDKHGWAVVTGYSTVYHERASNVFNSLKLEARFIELNETYWKGEEDDPYFKIYNEKRKRWEKLMGGEL